ncbi:serine hydrolase domain-containing protein [Sphingomonas astaxanthinifaciens]|uniref:Beta-lactamase-related domain-containing protein n=1 Tax=Sphingomonas astaxanthinifaciens DSM 22298 TaxID=1123267 RepID=A0ABQ5Z357_9SPHN|nr:serine hydrolase domain-containing protein [Sphingomonas astaxanthinifaciens]GLR46517.1 hypothetical protein GCM10007925_02280 [Sphingomonas astaxanthinifaciens DSM 22298]
MRFLLLPLFLALAACATAPRPGVVAGLAFTAAAEGQGFARGPADPAMGRAATLDDPVRVASVSKLVVAIGVMKLVDQGRLGLDSDLSPLLGWPLRNPAFPDRPVTLAMLLSHTGSVRDHDDQYIVPLGATVRAALDRPGSWDPAHAPGTYFTYANMNFPVIASAIERATGERFDRWMRREVLEPLSIDACYNWATCSDPAIARAIVLTQGGKSVRDDLHGVRPACPVFTRDGDPCNLTTWKPGDNGALFAPQGGLRISVRGLARIGRLLLNEGELDGVRLLSPASVRTLLANRWQYDGTNGETERGFYCAFGLATQSLATPHPGCRDDPVGDRGRWIGHAGEAYGLRSGLWIDPVAKVGIAYVVTGLDADPPGGRSEFKAAEEAAFRETAALLSRAP